MFYDLLAASRKTDDGDATSARSRRWDLNHGGSIAILATYLETILTIR